MGDVTDEWRPETDAPSGRWVIAKANPATKFVVPKGEVHENYGWEDTRQAVKLGGSWWMWSSDGGQLVHYRVEIGHTVLRYVPVPRLVCWADEPNQWCDIPDGVLNVVPQARLERIG